MIQHGRDSKGRPVVGLGTMPIGPLLSLLAPAMQEIATQGGSQLAAWAERVSTSGDNSLQAVPFGNTCFVDAVNGNNATAQRGNLAKPFLTIQAALNDALPGDLISIGAGVFNENVVVPEKDRLTIRGASVTGTVISAANDSPALSLTVTTPLTQITFQNLTVRKTAGLGPVMRIDGTGFATPNTALPAGAIFALCNIVGVAGQSALEATCIGGLFSVFSFLNGATSFLREVTTAFFFNGIADSMVARYQESQPTPGFGRGAINLGNLFVGVLTVQEQEEVYIDSASRIGQLTSALRVGATLGPNVQVRGEVQNTVALSILAAAGAGPAPVLNLDGSKFSALSLSGVDVTLYALSMRDTDVAAGGSVFIAGASSWDIDATGSSLPLPQILPFGSRLFPPGFFSSPQGGVLYVDSFIGDDALALANRRDRPFLTIQAALDVAFPGSVIEVGPGTFAENLTWPLLTDNLTLRGAGAGTTIVSVANGSPALLVAPTNAALLQGKVEGIAFEKTGGIGPLVLLDGTALPSPATALAQGFRFTDCTFTNAAASPTLQATCLGRLFLRECFFDGGTATLLQEVAEGICRDINFDALVIRWDQAGTIPGTARRQLEFQSCTASQVDHEDQAADTWDAACSVETYQAQQIADAAAASPQLTYRGQVTLFGPSVVFLAGAAGPGPLLDFSGAGVQAIDLDGPDVATFTVLCQGTRFAAGAGITIGAGATLWEIDAMASNADMTGSTIPAGNKVQRDKQSISFVLGAGLIPLGTGFLATVPEFINGPQVLVSPADNAAFVLLSDVPSAAMVGAPTQTVLVKGAAGAAITLLFSGN